MFAGYRNDQRLNLMRPFNITPVPKGLLLIMFIFLYNHVRAVMDGSEQRNGGQIMELDQALVCHVIFFVS
jgi:hypothetical protein